MLTKRSLFSIAFVGSAILAGAPAHGNTLLESNFETGEYASYGWNTSGNHPEIVSKDAAPVCRGMYSVKFPLSYYGSKINKRTELSLSRPEAGNLRNLEYGQEYWVGFAIYIPDGWIPDTEKNRDGIMQFHGVPDTDLGEAYRNPTMSISIQQDAFFFQSIWSAERVNKEEGGKQRTDGAFGLQVAKYKTGQWNEIVLHFKVSYTGDGFSEVWINNNKVFSRQNVGNAFNDKIGPYIKIGNYKSLWGIDHVTNGITSRVYWMDEIRIGDKDGASFDTVAPHCVSADSSSANPSSLQTPTVVELTKIPATQ